MGLILFNSKFPVIITFQGCDETSIYEGIKREDKKNYSFLMILSGSRATELNALGLQIPAMTTGA